MATPTSFIPVLSASDVNQAARLIQQAYAPAQFNVSTGDQWRLQQELVDIQKRQEAWGLVLPFLEHNDPNVQFFGAHTAQVKIARDWDSFPQEYAIQLRDFLLELTAQSILAKRTKVILRKLFVAVTSLALKIIPSKKHTWEDWLQMCITSFSSRGVSTEHILDFLSIAAEEVDTADLLGLNKAMMQRSLLDVASMVTTAIASSITGPRDPGLRTQLLSALRCLSAWMTVLPANELTSLIPALISLLVPSVSGIGGAMEFDDEIFTSASETLNDVLSKSSLGDGAGTATLTEPLLIWCEIWGMKIVEQTALSREVDTVSHSFCKLLVSLGDHSVNYFASNLVSQKLVSPSFNITSLSSFTYPAPRSRLVQTFLRLLLSYTSLPGYYGIDEDESEMTLGFWYLFQEALWSSDLYTEDAPEELSHAEQDVWTVAKAVYIELIQALKRKVTWPGRGSGWRKDQIDKFQVYRRDVGDTLINAYYVLRGDMIKFYVNDIIEQLATRRENDSWADIEADIHCILSVQEAVPLEPNPHLSQLLGEEILGRLPTTGNDRVRMTTLGLIGTYASWFTTQSPAGDGLSPPLLMNAIRYVASALNMPSLCFAAANSLRDLCDANRQALAPHIAAFGELHASLTDIPDSEKSKVLQSIASVIQALHPGEQISPLEAIARPVVQRLIDALQTSTWPREEAIALAVTQLQTLAGIAKGLTRMVDSILIFEESPEEQATSEQLKVAREDPRMVKLREDILLAVKRTTDLWSTDAEVGDAMSDLFKSITSLPSDTTLLSLPPAPLLELICLASQKQLTGTWLALASMLLVQLDPPLLLQKPTHAAPNEESQGVVVATLLQLLPVSLQSLSQPGYMASNPDIVQAFFGCLDTVARHFITAFYKIPEGLLDALIQCAISCLSLQERYSLVSACTFLTTLLHRMHKASALPPAQVTFAVRHGPALMRALLAGFAGGAPRSAGANLVELLADTLVWWPAQARGWMRDTLFADDFPHSKATNEAKEKFIKAVTSSASLRRTREAAQQFSLVARGLEGSSFGYASASV